MKDQTESPNAKKIPYLLELAAIEDGKRDNTFTAVSGEIALDNRPDLANNVVSLTLAELVKSKAHWDKQLEPGKAVEDMNKAPEPEPQPKTEEKETKVVKKTTRKTANKAGNKPVKATKTEKRVTAPKKKKTAKKEEKQPEK